ncbi:MAG: PaaI family thioesterase [Acidimicrobiales bacterium]
MQRVPYGNSETPDTKANTRKNTASEPEPVAATDGLTGTPGRTELARQVRRLIDLTTRSSLDNDQYGPLTAAIKAAVDTAEAPLQVDLAQHGAPAEAAALVKSEAANLPPERDPLDYVPLSPVIGIYNPLAPPVKVNIHSNGKVTGTVWLGTAYQGPPGCVHGGIIAAIFDELLGLANFAAGSPAMTGTLYIRYRKPTPLWHTLELTANIKEKGSRKTIAAGQLFYNGELTAEAEGIFVALSQERLMALSSKAATTSRRQP